MLSNISFNTEIEPKSPQKVAFRTLEIYLTDPGFKCMRGYNSALYEMAQDLNLLTKCENYQCYIIIEIVAHFQNFNLKKKGL